MGLSALADKLGISIETSKTKLFVWYLLTFIGPFKSLWTLAFVHGKNNGFKTNDWQEKYILVYLIDFVYFFLEANFVRGAFEDFAVSDKIWKKRD